MAPLLRRVPRQFKNNLGKYLGIFLLIAFTIAFVSGFLMGSGSIMKLTDELPTKYKLEDARITVSHKLTDQQLKSAQSGRFSWIDRLTMALADESADLDDYEKLTLYELFSHDVETVVPNDPVAAERAITMRVHRIRDQIDLPALHEGVIPTSANEIAIDPTFARNHELSPGDTIVVGGQELTVSGLVTLPDYTTLFEKNTDFLMDDLTFCVGIMTDEGYARFGDYSETYTYGIVFDNPDLTLAERTTGETNLVRLLVLSGATVTDLIDVDSNQGVIFASDDAAGDSLMYRVFFYIIIVVMAFIFVVITNTNIEKESSVIGTLLASGYGKGDLLRHYLVLPTIIAIAAVIAGNLGQSYFIGWTESAYYNSYSLPPFVVNWDPGIFVETSILPVVLLLVIEALGLMRKLKHTPLAFLRHETTNVHTGSGVHFPAVWPFFTRLRLRVLLANMGSVATIFIGIYISGILLLMGIGMLPIVNNMADEMAKSMPAEHVYTLKVAADLPEEDAVVSDQAEKLELASLEAPKKMNWGPLKTTAYGIEENSAYWPDIDVTGGKVAVGAGLASKTALGVGDTLQLTNRYADKTYTVQIASVVGSETDMNTYMSRGKLNDLLDNDDDDFNGWVSNEVLHFAAKDVATDLTPDDMTKMADQMRSSMSTIMQVITFAAVVVFIVVIYLLSKTVMERSSRPISQLKVFGYRDGELSRVYVRSLTVCVVVALLVSIPLIVSSLVPLIDFAMMDYDIVFIINIPWNVFAEYLGLGVLCYAAVAVLNKLHLRRVPLALALKELE